MTETGTLPRVSVVVVNFDGERHLEACFGALAGLRYPADRVELVLVDNGSTDGSLDLVGRRFPAVRVLVNDVNNYCRANNLGIAATDAPYVALLNNDTRVDPDWLGALVAVMEAEPALGAAGSVIYTKGAVASAGHQRTADLYWEDRRELVATRSGSQAPIDVDSLSGCAVLYRRQALADTGGLDERFNMYLEDVDLAIRLRARGWSLACVPTSIVDHIHHGTATEELARFYSERNRLLVLAKHLPRELPGAMVGRGYYSIGHDGNRGGPRADLRAIMPDLIATLVEHHELGVVREVLPDVFAELGRIALGDDAVSTRNARQAAHDIEKLREEIRRRDDVLEVKDRFAASLEAGLLARDQLIRDKDADADALRAEIRARDQMIRDKDADAEALRGEIRVRDQLIRDKDTDAEALRAEIGARDQMIRDKDTYVDSLQAEIRARDHLIRDKDAYAETLAEMIRR